MRKAALVAASLLSMVALCGCRVTPIIAATASPTNTFFVSPAPTPAATVAPTPSPAPTPAAPTPIPLKGAPRFSWERESIALPQPVYAAYHPKAEPAVSMDDFPALLWEGKEYEVLHEDDSRGSYVLHGSPFPNYREELGVVRRNTESETAGASCWWNFNGREQKLHMFDGTEQDAREAAESYFGNALGGDFIGSLGRFVADKTVSEKKIYTIRLYRSIDGMDLATPVISAYITKQGFRYYYLYLADYERDTAQVIERPLTFKEALYSLNYYYETRSSHPDFLQNYQLSDARLMLSDVFADESIRGQLGASLSPVWVFSLTKEKPDLDMSVEELVYVDVRTGAIYNGSNPGGLEDSPFYLG